MPNGPQSLRESTNSAIDSRIFIFVVFIAAFAHAQSDSARSIALSAGTEYSDLFRQRSNRSSTTILSRMSFLDCGTALGSDSLSISYRGYTHYASFNQNESKTKFSLTQQQHAMDARFNGGVSIFRYSISGGGTINSARNSYLYGGRISMSPWDDLAELSAEVRRVPSQFGSTVLFQDFLVNFDERPVSTEWRFAIGGMPVHNITGTISFSTFKGTTASPAAEYGTASAHISQTAEARIEFRLDDKTSFGLLGSSTEDKTNSTLKRDNVSFGSLSDGSQTYDHIGIAANTRMWSFRFTVGYAFDQIRFTGAGRVESWPFTSFAASVISNRLFFRTTGFIKQHTVLLTTPFTYSSIRMLVGLSYHRILPDVVLEHWEPELFVFGMKNFVRDPFSIRDAHLGKAAVSVEVPLMSSSLKLFAEQYFPLSITYRSHRPVLPLPAPEPLPATSIETDGGRRFGIHIGVMF